LHEWNTNSAHLRSPALTESSFERIKNHDFVPDHTLTGLKFFRDKAGSGDPSIRRTADLTSEIPAQEPEGVVLGELRSLLASADRIASALAAPSDDVPHIRVLIESARQAAKSLGSNPHAFVSQFLSAVVDRILIHKESVEIRIKRDTLYAKLLDPNRALAKGFAKQSATEERLVLDIAARFRRCRGELRLVIPSPNEARESGKPIPSLIKAIARAQDWVRAIVTGEYRDQRAIAKAIGVNERYVSHVIAGAFLAPQIVESAVRGSQEMSSVSLSKLLDQVPLSWTDQHRTLGDLFEM
jgi:hypothetical protein